MKNQFRSFHSKSVLICVLFTVFHIPLSYAQLRGIINNQQSSHVVMRNIDIGDCRWTSGFWADKFKSCEQVMVPHMGALLKSNTGHAYHNFKIAAGLRKGDFKGTWWHDGDFYKWMEASVYVYAINKNKKILKELDEIIDVIGKAQEEDGYLSTPIQIKGIERYAERKHHELYNSGHLLTCACIHYRVTGKTNLLEIAIKNANYLYEVFQPRPKKLARFGFNPSQIMGLVELYRTTRDSKYLKLAEIFVDMRGKQHQKKGLDPAVRPNMRGDMAQDRVPLRKENEAVGHAVLGLYLYAGAADVYAETGDKTLLKALDRIWDNVVNKKMYVTGACGQTHHGASSRKDFVHEAFIDEYMMPNATAYNETCANIANAMFNWRMLNLKGKSKYADVIELVLYNSALSGISLDGMHYFYTNPLRRTHDQKMDTTDYQTRAPYIKSFCCPPNLVRTIAKVSAWAYSLTENGLAVNLYGGNKLATRLQDRSEIKLKQETKYPWDGKVRITIQACKKKPFELKLRIPEWAEESKILLNGKEISTVIFPGKYAGIKRSWIAGDVLELDMPMKPSLVIGHPRIEEVRNQAAIKRGPVVYCLETPDLPYNAGILDVYLPSNIKLEIHNHPQYLGGISTLNGEVLLQSNKRNGLYHTLEKTDWKNVKVRFVPYFAWANRGKCEMTVWMPIVWAGIK